MCVINDNDNTEGYWKIGDDPADDTGSVKTKGPARDMWPHQIEFWEYYSGWWELDLELDVTGNINKPFGVLGSDCSSGSCSKTLKTKPVAMFLSLESHEGSNGPIYLFRKLIVLKTRPQITTVAKERFKRF